MRKGPAEGVLWLEHEQIVISRAFAEAVFSAAAVVSGKFPVPTFATPSLNAAWRMVQHRN
jgi:hypothetical protein